jgi:RNA polymerase sigma-70 factor (ECF subfamily)
LRAESPEPALRSEGPSDFGQLIQEVRDGSEEAARQLVEQYGPHILRVVRRRLNRDLRAKFDSVDFVQAVWASFFADRPGLQRFRGPEDVANFLAAMASNKVIDETRRRLHTRKRDVSREEVLPESVLVAPQPTPSEVVSVQEQWDQLLVGQPAHYQKILRLRREGVNCKDIAAQLHLNEKTVRRVVQKLLPKATP